VRIGSAWISAQFRTRRANAYSTRCVKTAAPVDYAHDVNPHTRLGHECGGAGSKDYRRGMAVVESGGSCPGSGHLTRRQRWKFLFARADSRRQLGRQFRQWHLRRFPQRVDRLIDVTRGRRRHSILACRRLRQHWTATVIHNASPGCPPIGSAKLPPSVIRMPFIMAATLGVQGHVEFRIWQTSVHDSRWRPIYYARVTSDGLMLGLWASQPVVA